MYIKKNHKDIRHRFFALFVYSCLLQGVIKTRTVKEVVVDHQDENMYVTDDAIRRTIFKDPQAKHPMGLLRLMKLKSS